MGITVMALLGAIVFFVKSLVSLFSYISWKSNPVVTGVVGERLREEKHGHGMKRTFLFTLGTGTEQIVSEYTVDENVNTELPIMAGDRIGVFFDAQNAKWREVAALEDRLCADQLSCIACLALLLICMVLFPGWLTLL